MTCSQNSYTTWLTHLTDQLAWEISKKRGTQMLKKDEINSPSLGPAIWHLRFSWYTFTHTHHSIPHSCVPVSMRFSSLQVTENTLLWQGPVSMTTTYSGRRHDLCSTSSYEKGSSSCQWVGMNSNMRLRPIYKNELQPVSCAERTEIIESTEHHLQHSYRVRLVVRLTESIIVSSLRHRATMETQSTLNVRSI